MGLAVCSDSCRLEARPEPDGDTSECAVDGSAQEVLFYLYAPDLKSLQAMLLAEGIEAGEISYPDYLPNGEFRTQDPDGYTLMIAQSAADTP